MKLVGIEPDKKMDEDAKKDFVSCFLSFKNAFDSRGGDRFDYPVGDAFLRFIHIFGYDTVKKIHRQIWQRMLQNHGLNSYCCQKTVQLI